MATVATIMSNNGMTISVDSIIGGRLVRHYTGNGQSQALIKTGADELQAEVTAGTCVLGNGEPDVVLMQTLENQTIVVR